MPTIFKFSPNKEYCIKTLIENKLYFSDPKGFNDPFDGRPELVNVKFETSQDIKEYFVKLNKSSFVPQLEKIDERLSLALIEKGAIDTYKRLLKSKMSEIFVCCFSTSKSNNLMWYNYANNHKGFVSEFYAEIFNKREIEVEYRKDFPFLNPAKISKDAPHLLNSIFKYKSIEWSHEKEIRLLSINNYGSYNSEYLKSVYFGMNSSKKLKRDIFEGINSVHNHVKFYQMKRIDNSYILGYDEIHRP